MRKGAGRNANDRGRAYGVTGIGSEQETGEESALRSRKYGVGRERWPIKQRMFSIHDTNGSRKGVWFQTYAELSNEKPPHSLYSLSTLNRY